jgi:hypothetical protein
MANIIQIEGLYFIQIHIFKTPERFDLGEWLEQYNMTFTEAYKNKPHHVERKMIELITGFGVANSFTGGPIDPNLQWTIEPYGKVPPVQEDNYYMFILHEDGAVSVKSIEDEIDEPDFFNDDNSKMFGLLFEHLGDMLKGDMLDEWSKFGGSPLPESHSTEPKKHDLSKYQSYIDTGRRILKDKGDDDNFYKIDSNTKSIKFWGRDLISHERSLPQNILDLIDDCIENDYENIIWDTTTVFHDNIDFLFLGMFYPEEDMED